MIKINKKRDDTKNKTFDIDFLSSPECDERPPPLITGD